jgi:hypothetical protein
MTSSAISSLSLQSQCQPTHRSMSHIPSQAHYRMESCQCLPAHLPNLLLLRQLVSNTLFSYHYIAYLEECFGSIDVIDDLTGSVLIELSISLLFFDLEVVGHVHGVLVLQEVTDLLKLIETIVWTVHDYMVHHFHQVLVQIHVVFSLVVSEQGAQVVEGLDLRRVLYHFLLGRRLLGFGDWLGHFI